MVGFVDEVAMAYGGYGEICKWHRGLHFRSIEVVIGDQRYGEYD